MSQAITQLKASADYIRQQYPYPIHLATILGSGLGDLAETIPNAVKIPYSQIPFFPSSSVAGHQGELCLGEVRPGIHIAFLKGRIHYYEGHGMDKILYPLRVLRLLEAQILLVTNAAGGVNPNFKAGDLMLIEDHINLMGTNPLIGENIDELGPRFPDMSDAYTQNLRELTLKRAAALSISLQRGVYCAMSGPSYETPAEIRMVRTLGADAVGMSTVPEVIAASHMGMQVLGISCITNPAAGVVTGHHLNHEEVLEAANQAKASFSRLVQAILAEIPVQTLTHQSPTH